MAKPIETQYTYKKCVGFTETQKKSLKRLKLYGVDINQFIRQAVKEKLQREWKVIKEEKQKRIKNAPDWMYD